MCCSYPLKMICFLKSIQCVFAFCSDMNMKNVSDIYFKQLVLKFNCFFYSQSYSRQKLKMKIFCFQKTNVLKFRKSKLIIKNNCFQESIVIHCCQWRFFKFIIEMIMAIISFQKTMILNYKITRNRN